jgi:hypothetical protein
VVGLLHLAQQHNANQLAGMHSFSLELETCVGGGLTYCRVVRSALAFCLHFIASNYQPMSKRPEFSTLADDNLEYIETNQWPPKSYLEELAVYEKAIKETDKDAKCICM